MSSPVLPTLDSGPTAGEKIAVRRTSEYSIEDEKIDLDEKGGRVETSAEVVDVEEFSGELNATGAVSISKIIYGQQRFDDKEMNSRYRISLKLLRMQS